MLWKMEEGDIGEKKDESKTDVSLQENFVLVIKSRINM